MRRGAWRSLVSALVWGTRGPEFKSRRPDWICGTLAAATVPTQCPNASHGLNTRCPTAELALPVRIGSGLGMAAQRQALEHAARRLGISRRTLAYRLEKYGLSGEKLRVFKQGGTS